MVRTEVPDLNEELNLLRRGYQRIAGVDEVGRGPLAGPVVAAAVVLPPRLEARWLGDVRDSKLLSAAARQRLFEYINDAAAGIGIGICDAATIDRLGIVAATRRAMVEAVWQIQPRPDWLLVDYLQLPSLSIPQKSIPGGDRSILSIACASIVAKVTRDRLMLELGRYFPGYGFARHKGYGTPEHLARLRTLGPCPVHRRSFRPVREWRRL